MDLSGLWNNISSGDHPTATQPPGSDATQESAPSPLPSQPSASPNPFPNGGGPNELLPFSIVTLAATVTVSTIVVAARIYTRRVISRQFGIEDYLCIWAWATFVAYSTIGAVIGLRHSGGEHTDYMTPVQKEDFDRWVNILQCTYGPSIASAKIAILTLYLRFFTSRRSGFLYYTILGSIAVVSAYYIAVTLSKIFECVPRARIWDKSVDGRCIDIELVLVITSAFNLFTDFWIWALPLWKLWKMNIKSSKKSGTAAIFLFGLLAPIVSSIRLAKTLELQRSQDVNFTMYQLVLWTVSENAIGVICACLPVFPRLYKTIMRSYHDWRSGHRQAHTSYMWSNHPAGPSLAARAPQPEKSATWVTASPSHASRSRRPSLPSVARCDGDGPRPGPARDAALADVPRPPSPPDADKALPSLPSRVSLDSDGGLRVPRAMMGPRDPECYACADDDKAAQGLTELDGHKPLASPKARRHARFLPDEEEMVDL